MFLIQRLSMGAGQIYEPFFGLIFAFMAPSAPLSPARLSPRKRPQQARSVATVEVILEATLQVLLTHGATRLTTTRVAERAGVSVGTIYQYFTDKQALLYAVLLRHFEEMAIATEQACEAAGEQPLTLLSERIAEAQVGVKAARPEVTRVLYQVAGVIAQDKLSTDIQQRLVRAVASILSNASDADFDDPERCALVVIAALAGLARAVFREAGPSRERIEFYRQEAVLLTKAYLEARSRPG